MKPLIISAAIAICFGAPAVANEQLARSIGVEPGKYTTAELIQMKFIAEDDDRSGNRVLAAEFARRGEIISTQGTGNPAAGARLAASLGVDPGDFTVSELAALHLADVQEDRWLVRAILSRNSEVISTQGGSEFGGGHLQLARALGVHPAEMTLAELAAAYLDLYD